MIVLNLGPLVQLSVEMVWIEHSGSCRVVRFMVGVNVPIFINLLLFKYHHAELLPLELIDCHDEDVTVLGRLCL